MKGTRQALVPRLSSPPRADMLYLPHHHMHTLLPGAHSFSSPCLAVPECAHGLLPLRPKPFPQTQPDHSWSETRVPSLFPTYSYRAPALPAQVSLCQKPRSSRGRQRESSPSSQRASFSMHFCP